MDLLRAKVSRNPENWEHREFLTKWYVHTKKDVIGTPNVDDELINTMFICKKLTEINETTWLSNIDRHFPDQDVYESRPGDFLLK